MRDDFCIFILSHGRPHNVVTFHTLMKCGYDGKLYIVIDDEDDTADQYRRRFGDKVLMFSKSEVAKRIDVGDNFDGRKSIIYARNACFNLARQVGCRYFMQLDDDYMAFEYTVNSQQQWNYMRIKHTFNEVLEAMLKFYADAKQVGSIAMAQGGDFIGGSNSFNELTLRRKCMNSFVCSTDREFEFYGRMNDDVNTYVWHGRTGLLLFTLLSIKLVQKQTQVNAGGLTDMYRQFGTYVKSFYTVMYAPSCTRIGTLGDYRSPHFRIHHDINWRAAVPKILSEQHRKV